MGSLAWEFWARAPGRLGHVVPDIPRLSVLFSPASNDEPGTMDPDPHASRHVTSPTRAGGDVWFETKPEAEQACDEPWTAKCREEIVDTDPVISQYMTAAVPDRSGRYAAA